MLRFTEFCTITEAVVVSEGSYVFPTAQPWGDLPAKMNPEDAALATYVAATEKVKGLERRLEAMLKRACSGQAKVLVGVKSFNSFKDKVINRGRPASDVTDLLRAAVLTDSEEQTQQVIHNLKKSERYSELEHKDKGSDPKFGYYGSYHLKLVLDGVRCEVQVMTRRLWTYKEWGHQFYNQFRSGGTPDPEVLRKSKMVFAMGNYMPMKGGMKPYSKYQ